MARARGGYVSPAPGGTIGRTDQGVDWGTTPGSPIVAIGDAIIEFVGRYSGFGHYVAYRLLSGPAAGQEVFTAEFAQPTVRVGQRVRRGQQIGVAGSSIEAGLAQRGGTYLPIAQTEPDAYRAGEPHTRPTAAGQRFRALLGGAGAGAGASIGLEELWLQAGGPPKVARIMAAIALAESGGRVDAKGGPNDDGSLDYGLWQINSSHRAYNPERLLSDPLYNARAAVAVYRTQGLDAWTAYRSGAYLGELDRAPGATVPELGRAPITRPGGSTPADDAAGAQDIAWRDYFNLPVPGLQNWNPLDILRGARDAVDDIGSFLKWVAWLFHPRNILRIVEFTTGAGLFAFGIWTSVKTFENAETGPAPTRTVSRAFELTPAGRAVGVRRARRQGRRRARFEHAGEERSQARSKARRSERSRLKNRELGRRSQSNEVPF